MAGWLRKPAAVAGTYVLADEAYGDFIPREGSAIARCNRYDNLMVLRTFSKGFGLTGLISKGYGAICGGFFIAFIIPMYTIGIYKISKGGNNNYLINL